MQTQTNVGIKADHREFLRQINAQPDDFTTRGVYADWLTDHGYVWQAAAWRWLNAEGRVPCHYVFPKKWDWIKACMVGGGESGQERDNLAVLPDKWLDANGNFTELFTPLSTATGAFSAVVKFLVTKKKNLIRKCL